MYLAENPSLREASCCSVVVRNGAYGERRYGLRSTRVDPEAGLVVAQPGGERGGARAVQVQDARCRAVQPCGVKSRPWATRVPSTVSSVAVKLVGLSGSLSLPCSSVANSASRSQ